MQTSMFIDGQPLDGEDRGWTLLDPRTADPIATINEASVAQVESAVQAAAAAFNGWRRTTPAQRGEILLKLADRIEGKADVYAALEARNCGKPLHLVLRDEIPFIVDALRFYAGAGRCLQAPVGGEYVAGHPSFIRRDPIGVVASIAPWNYPLMMAVWKLAAPIMAGNTVVLKPSELTPLTTFELAADAASLLPPGVLNVVYGRGETVGNALTNHPGVAMISVTGDIATGRKVLGAATKTIKRTHLELGGKAPVIVLDDADPAEVARAVRHAGFYNAGQDCTAACRIYCADSLYDRLLVELGDAVSSLSYAHADDALNEIPPLISERQRSRVAAFVERASELEHTEILTGGDLHDGPGFHFKPTVVAHARHRADAQFDFARHGFGDRAVRRRQRHGDGDMAFMNVDAVDQAQVVDIDRDFRVVNVLQRVDHRFVQVAAGLARRLICGLLRQETVQIVALARGRVRRLDTRPWRRVHRVHFLDHDLAFVGHPKIFLTRAIPRTSASTSLSSLYRPKLARAVASTPR